MIVALFLFGRYSKYNQIQTITQTHPHKKKRNKQTYKTQTHPFNFKTTDKEDYIILHHINKQTNKQTHPSNLKTADKEDYTIFI